MKKYFIGDILVSWQGKNIKFRDEEYFSLFKTEENTFDETISFRECEMNTEDFALSHVLKKTGGYELLETDGRIFLMNHWSKNRFGYGFWTDEMNLSDAQKIYVNPSLGEDYPISADRFFSTVGLSGKLLRKKAVILHASYIEYGGKGILFTAQSQTGKTTQALLWQKHENARIINGDRALLRKKENEWLVYGYPCCGSSKICENKTLPLGAIVVLEQGKENLTEALTQSEKIKAVVSGSVLYNWDEDEILSALSLAEEISREVPVIRLSCRADEEAVSVLKTKLEAMKIW